MKIKKDNADSDAAPYHSYKKQKIKNYKIKQGTAAFYKRDAVVPCCFEVNGKNSFYEKEAAM